MEKPMPEPVIVTRRTDTPHAMPKRPPRRLLPLALLATVAGCGGSGDAGTPPAAMPTTPTVAVSPAATAISTRQSVSVAIAVTGSGGVAADGTIVLTSGAFSSGTVALAQGRATIAVPAGVLATGSDTLTASYTPGTTVTATYAAASGNAMVAVTDGGGATVATQSVDLPVNGHPFQALPIGTDLFVSTSANANAGSQTGISVYSTAAPGLPAARCVQVSSHTNHVGSTAANGLAATPDGNSILVADDDAGIAAFSRAAMVAGCMATEALIPQGSIASAQGSFAVTVTPDGKYAFVANEYGVVANDSTGTAIGGNVGVVALTRDASGVVNGGTLVGQFSTGGQAIANVTLSPDGSRLYVTSEIADPGANAVGTGNMVLAHSGCSQGTDANGVAQTSGYGLLTIVDVAKAEASANASAIIATVASGCSPVRVVETADQQVIWVAARGDNRVLAFSTHMLETNPAAALLGYGDTGGIAPVGLQLFHGDTLLAVANSNRFSSPSMRGNMTILNATAVKPTIAANVAATYFPRSVAVAADGSTLYLTDFRDAKVQIVTTTVN